MKQLSEEKLSNITGGGVLTSAGLWLGIAAVVVFVIGGFGGYANPNSCNG